MADIVSPEKRSEMMSRIRSKNTQPELRIRSALHKLGYRFRIHVVSLPGKPDVVLPRYKTVIQVRGCFWHGHSCRDGARPHSREEYWIPKLDGNRKRDRRNDRQLRALGWSVLIVWECRCRSRKGLERELRRLDAFLQRRLKLLSSREGS